MEPCNLACVLVVPLQRQRVDILSATIVTIQCRSREQSRKWLQSKGSLGTPSWKNGTPPHTDWNHEWNNGTVLGVIMVKNITPILLQQSRSFDPTPRGIYDGNKLTGLPGPVTIPAVSFVTNSAL
eukprot:3987303-Amphidinium_carterae.1